MIVKLDEQMLRAIGFDNASIIALRHLMRQIGIQEHGTTLPEVAGQADALTPVVNGLVITITATNVTVAELGVEATEHRAPDANVQHRLAELEAALDQSRLDCSGLRRAVEEAAINGEERDGQMAALARRISQLEDRHQ